jgi:restriction endonuclease
MRRGEEDLVPVEQCLYDPVVIHPSDEIEHAFAEGLGRHGDRKLCIKVPAWFTIATPIEEYNPD